MSYWLTDPQLFLYAKGTGSDDVHLWRCKKPASSSSSLVVPLKPDDFDYVETVTDYMELLANTIDWDETDYKRLVKYIFERRLLVNGQGFVIAELHKADEDGNKIDDDANEEVPPIYIRSLDVLALKHYIPRLRERPIPFRSVLILEDEDGKAAVMEKNFNIVTKLTARVEHLESENNTLDSKVKTLEGEVEHLESENNTLDSKVKTLEGEVTKLTADRVTQMNALATVQQELGRMRNKEVWMNDFSNSEWVGVEGLIHDSGNVYDKPIIIKPLGTFIQDDSTTNVLARYWYMAQLSVNGVINKPSFFPRVICLDDLTLNKEKARFSPQVWAWAIKSQEGKTYIAARDSSCS